MFESPWKPNAWHIGLSRTVLVLSGPDELCQATDLAVL